MGEQDWPLSPAVLGSSTEEGRDISAEQSKRDTCCRTGVICCAATTLIIGVIVLILALTVFKVRKPELTLNLVTIEGLALALRQGNPPRPGLNVTAIADISVKNRNSFSFKFTNATTQLYYGGVVIGEARNPPGNAGAHRTIHLNVTVDVMVDTVMSIPRLPSDIVAGQMPIATYTDMLGRVNVLNIVKKHIEVKLNCTMIVVLSTQLIKDQVCKRTVYM